MNRGQQDDDAQRRLAAMPPANLDVMPSRGLPAVHFGEAL